MLKSLNQLRSFRHAVCFHRTYVAESRRIRKWEKKNPAEQKISKEIQAYFGESSNEDVLKYFPDKLLKRKLRPPEGLYIATEDCARTVADILKKDLRPDQPILEVNPGMGVLSNKLIKETENDLLLFEPTEALNLNLEILVNRHYGRNILLKQADFTSLWRLAYIDKIDSNSHRVDEILKGITRADYEDEPNARLFAAITSLAFMRHMVNSVIFQNNLMSYGRCELYLCMPPSIYIHLTCSNKAGYMLYRATSVLFQILFEYEFICKLNRKHFLPWQSDIKQVPYMKMTHLGAKDAQEMYLMRAVPRKDLHLYCTPENLTTLWFFVKQHFVSRKNRVIPTLERWIPGCGPRLIVNTKTSNPPELLNPKRKFSTPAFCEPCRKLSIEDFSNNINIFTEFGDLTPTQVLTLFDQFINWPEYKESSFEESLEATLMKLHTNPDDTVDGVELPEEEDDVEAKNTESP